MISLNLLLLTILSFLFASSVVGEDVTVQVHVIARHGDRAPIKYINIPKYKEEVDSIVKSLNTDYGQLTPLGMYQCHKLGLSLQNRYIKNNIHAIKGISTTYNNSQYEFLSSGVDRTIQCGLGISEGLFTTTDKVYSGPKEVGKNIKGIPQDDKPLPAYLQLLSVRSSQPAEDMLLRAFDNCPTITNDRVSFRQSTSYANYADKFKNEIQRLNEVFKWKKDEKTFHDYVLISDTLQALRNHKLIDCDEDCSSAIDIGKKALAKEFDPSIIMKKGAGVLLHNITTNMENFKNGLQTTKFHLYTAHDTTLLSLFSALNIPPKEDQPSECSSLLIELVQNEEKFFVNVHYQKEWDSSPIILPLKDALGCQPGPGCKFENWLNKRSSFEETPKDWCDTCSNQSANICLKNRISDLMVIIMWVLILCFSVLVIFMCCTFCCLLIFIKCIDKRKLSNAEPKYMPVATDDILSDEEDQIDGDSMFS